jgi:hypothetical protein
MAAARRWPFVTDRRAMRYVSNEWESRLVVGIAKSTRLTDAVEKGLDERLDY